MKTLSNLLLANFLLIFTTGCAENPTGYHPLDDYEQLDPTTIFAMPEALTSPSYSPEQLQRGKYMTGLWGVVVVTPTAHSSVT